MTPPIEDYSKDPHAAAAAKVKAIGDPCPRDTVNDTACSAGLVIDYIGLRQRKRVEHGNDYNDLEQDVLCLVRPRSRRSGSGTLRMVGQAKLQRWFKRTNR